MKKWVLGMVALVLLLLWPFLFKAPLWLPVHGELHYLSGDFAGIFYPWTQVTIFAWHEGGLPLYTPYEGLGRPLTSKLQSQIFFPPMMILAFLFPQGVTYVGAEMYELLLLGLGGIGVFFLARACGLRQWSATFSGAIFSGGGFFLNHIANMAMTSSAVFAPWVLAATLKAMERDGARWIPAAALAVAFSVLGGLPQPAYYAILLITLIALWTAVERRSLKPLLRYAAIGLLAAAFAAPALLPGAVDLPQLFRSGDWQRDLNAPELLPARLLSPIAPQVSAGMGATAAFASFAGAGVLIIAVAGVMGGALRRRGLLIFCLGAAFFIAIAATLNLYDVLKTILPGFGFFREHERAGVMVTAFLALFAGAGLQTIRNWSAPQKIAAGITCFVLVAAQGMALLLSPGLNPGEMFLLQTSLFAGSALLVYAATLLNQRAAAVFVVAGICLAELFTLGITNNMRPGVTDSYRALENTLSPLLDAETSRTPIPRVARRDKRNIANQVAAFGLNTLYTGNSNPYRQLLQFWSLGERNDTVLDQFDVRYLVHDVELSQEPRPPAEFPLSKENRALRFDLGDRMVQEIRLITDAPAEAAAVVAGKPTLIEMIPTDAGVVGSLTFDEKTNIEALWVRNLSESELRIEQVLLDGEEWHAPPRYERVKQGLYRNTDAYPRAYLVPHAESFPGIPRMTQTMRDGVDLQERVLLLDGQEQEHTNVDWSVLQWASASARITQYRGRTVDIEVNAPTEAWLVLSDFYHKNWRAFVDGKEQPVQRANFVARAVRVPAGNYTVVFRYEDPLVAVGLVLTGLAVVISIAIVLIGRKGKRAGGDE